MNALLARPLTRRDFLGMTTLTAGAAAVPSVPAGWGIWPWATMTAWNRAGIFYERDADGIGVLLRPRLGREGRRPPWRVYFGVRSSAVMARQAPGAWRTVLALYWNPAEVAGVKEWRGFWERHWGTHGMIGCGH